MAKNKEQVIEEQELNEEEGTPAIFLRKVDVIIQNGEDEEPIIIKNTEEKEDDTVVGDSEVAGDGSNE